MFQIYGKMLLLLEHFEFSFKKEKYLFHMKCDLSLQSCILQYTCNSSEVCSFSEVRQSFVSTSLSEL